jgi:hypothetical protein
MKQRLGCCQRSKPVYSPYGDDLLVFNASAWNIGYRSLHHRTWSDVDKSKSTLSAVDLLVQVQRDVDVATNRSLEGVARTLHASQWIWMASNRPISPTIPYGARKLPLAGILVALRGIIPLSGEGSEVF